MNLTGKPSVDKPWLQFYPEQLRNVEVPKMTIEEFLKFKNQDENRIAFEYYGNKITWKTLWKEVDKAARSLKVLGYGDGRRIPLFLQSVPAHYISGTEGYAYRLEALQIKLVPKGTENPELPTPASAKKEAFIKK